MSETRPFRVADDAVQYVAGQRVPESRIMHFTEEAARYDVLSGVLIPAETVQTDADATDADAAAAPRRRRTVEG